VIAACSHSISGRLSRKLAIVTMLMLALLFSGAWLSVKMLMKEKNYEELQFRGNVIAQILALELKNGGEQACLSRVRADAPMRANTRLELWRADGQPFYADPSVGSHAMSEHIRSVDFDIEAPQLAGGLLKARYTVDFSADAKFGRNWMVVFVVITLLAGAMVWAGSRWHVRRALRPLNELAAQTRAISARRLDQRLSLADPAEELLPWVEQLNALMQRLDGAVAQLEGFNADVAHELRTPLAALIGHRGGAVARTSGRERCATRCCPTSRRRSAWPPWSTTCCSSAGRSRCHRAAWPHGQPGSAGRAGGRVPRGAHRGGRPRSAHRG
jgi:two-component system heavy metal sensor histidine kinase CusS